MLNKTCLIGAATIVINTDWIVITIVGGKRSS